MQINQAECKSLIGSPVAQDHDMHRTNVAELTTRVAPTAEITIGKICERRDNLDGMVESLAEPRKKGSVLADSKEKADKINSALINTDIDTSPDLAIPDDLAEDEDSNTIQATIHGSNDNESEAEFNDSEQRDREAFEEARIEAEAQAEEDANTANAGPGDDDILFDDEELNESARALGINNHIDIIYSRSPHRRLQGEGGQ
ncbi:unnamed protein product [Clonostachys byssicola]|uniref:Uncharacterized protein n=1 Tax=Clonostachys byssicola TaxID=160290 RepID=A0A9N9UFP3_9HYPO|nr:unnamed protein product [Clonostachys byssicola]